MGARSFARHAASAVEAVLASKRFDGDVMESEPLARHTTYRIGGPARYFVVANDLGSLTRLIEACKVDGTPWMVIGRGSNLLVADEGYDGAIITLGRDFRSLNFDEDIACFTVGAGTMLSAVVQEAFRLGYGGMEFAVGTPGTIGGALRMNAGSHDSWIGSRVRTVTLLSEQGELQRVSGEAVEWGYRTTSFAAADTLLECEISVEKGEPFSIHGKMEANLNRRKSSQPLGQPSCGSVFRNPEGDSAGALIERVGLKGHSIGGAQVSTKHANFIVNTGEGRAADVRALIELIQTKVNEAYGIELKPEVRFIGFE